MVAADEPWFIEQAAPAAVCITHMIDTYLHADHVSGGRHLAELHTPDHTLDSMNLLVSDGGASKFPGSRSPTTAWSAAQCVGLTL